jgi:hypothetical protein
MQPQLIEVAVVAVVAAQMYQDHRLVAAMVVRVLLLFDIRYRALI